MFRFWYCTPTCRLAGASRSFNLHFNIIVVSTGSTTATQSSLHHSMFDIRCSIFLSTNLPCHRPGRLRQAGDTNKHELYQSLRFCFKHSVTLCRHCVTLCKTVVKNHSFILYHRGFDRLNHHHSIFTSSFDVRYSMFVIFIHERHE